MENIIPKPVSLEPGNGFFILATGANINISPGSSELQSLGQYLADRLNPATGFGINIIPAGGALIPGDIYLSIDEGDPALGEEGYELTITPEQVTLRAYQPAGLFRGVQTIRQLLPAAIEGASPAQELWVIPSGNIRDYPRFAWRGAMLDVSRHFFGVIDVKRYIDLLAYYKMNRLHLHLSDDQGWRIMINAWPKLAQHGGSTEVGGGAGGYYTQTEYADLVAYAQSRYITIVPEIDMPSHTNAALASYPELNCNDIAPALYTGIEVGFSSLCVNKEITYRFIEDVVKELAALTPGPYLHIGGDEAHSTNKSDYKRFIERIQPIVAAHGKQMIGWEEIAQADLLPDTIVQHWFNDGAQKAASQGNKVIMSPASKAYLDMKYDDSSPLGLNWAGNINLQDGYTWDPVKILGEAPENAVLGVEAPLWSETLQTVADVEYMAFPRLPGIAEIGWSQVNGRAWDEYKLRLAAHGPRLEAMGVNFYRAPDVLWEK